MTPGKFSGSFLARTALISAIVLLGSVRVAHAQADMIIATNAEVVLPSTVDEIDYFYFFTVADDGGGISAPTITNLSYTTGSINQIDVYDSGEFTYATFEVKVTIGAPKPGESINDCFTITYEGESVNPCFDVTTAPEQEPGPEDIVRTCILKKSGLMRVVAPTASCKSDEYLLELVKATRATTGAAATALGVPAEFRLRGQ